MTSKDAAGNETKTAAYTYDVNNRRIAKAVDADGSGTATLTIERYVYDGQNIVLSFDGSGTQTHRYLHGTGVDQVLADENAQGTLWTMADHQGSIRDVLDNTGTLQNHIVYDSFGKITSQTNASATTIYGYTGREYDSETGLYFYRARYYDPSTGGFISEDPIGFEAGDYNLYRYVGNSPTNANDPSGLIIDTLVDIGFIGYDIYRIAKDNIFGNCDNLGENLLALGADVAGALIPFATGGGAAIRASRAANQAIDAARAADRATDAARGIDRVTDASRGLDRAGDGARSSHLADNFAPQSPSHNPINPSPINNSSGVHGNSNQSTNPQHVYIIKNPQTGELIKPGISGRPLNRDGSSPRANQQVNAMNRANPGSAEAVIVERNAGSRQNAKDIEQMITDRHAVRNNGAMPSPYHRSPLPSVGTQQDFYNKYGFPHNQTPYNGRY